MPLADTSSMLVERERNDIETELEAAKRRVSELEKMLASNQIVETAPVAGLETGHAERRNAEAARMNRRGEPADAELLESDDADGGKEEEDEKAAGPAETPRAVGELEGHESRVFKAVFSPIDDTLLASCSEDDTCRIWDVAQCKQLFCLQGHSEAVFSVNFSPDGSHLLTSGSDGKILIWDLSLLTLGMPGSMSSLAVVQTIALAGASDAHAAQFLDSKTIAAAIDDKVVLWDIETAQIKASRTIRAATDYVFGGRERNPEATPWIFSLQHHAPSSVMAIGVSDATVRILDANLNEQVVMRGHSRDVTSLKFRSDGRELLSGSGDFMAGVWDLSALQVRQVLRGHEASVHDCCYWPGSDEREVATVSMDRTLRLWCANSGSPLATVGPTVTAKLCLAPNDTLKGVAVAGGENKTLTANDFRISLLSKDPNGLKRLAAKAPLERAYFG